MLCWTASHGQKRLRLLGGPTQGAALLLAAWTANASVEELLGAQQLHDRRVQYITGSTGLGLCLCRMGTIAYHGRLTWTAWDERCARFAATAAAPAPAPTAGSEGAALAALPEELALLPGAVAAPLAVIAAGSSSLAGQLVWPAARGHHVVLEARLQMWKNFKLWAASAAPPVLCWGSSRLSY